MRYPPEQKERTRQRILEAAAAAFRQYGYRGAGVDRVMAQAGLTSGGFYAHFACKEALLAAMLPYAAHQTREQREGGLEESAHREWVEGFVQRYLSTVHRDQVAYGCPFPALISEIARAGEPTRQMFEKLFRGLASRLAAHLPEEEGQPAEGRALAMLALCVGGLSVARAVADPAFGEQLLAACREFALKDQPPARDPSEEDRDTG